MKDSTNFSFFVKILALAILLIVSYSKDDLFPSSETDEEEFEPINTEANSSVYFVPLTTTEETSNLASFISKNN